MGRQAARSGACMHPHPVAFTPFTLLDDWLIFYLSESNFPLLRV
jgi:hypothetical protein